MRVVIEVSKYDILGMASLMGSSEEVLERIEKYINENESIDVDFIKKDKETAEIKTAINAIAITQIAKNLNM